MKQEINNFKELELIEKLEQEYLNKYYHFLRFAEKDLLFGFKTKYSIEEVVKKLVSHYKKIDR